MGLGDSRDMARTRQFGRLVRLVQDLREVYRKRGESEGTSLAFELEQLRIGRRRWLQEVTSFSAMGLGLVACQDPEVVAQPEPDAGPSTLDVAIVGAGIAGLHCAYRLQQAGVKCTVFEASTRVGGRMYSDREHFGDQVAELGGEFIDTDHTTLHTLAAEFKIQLDDREAELGDTPKDLWWIDGKSVPEATIVEQFSKVAPLMASLIERIEEDGDDALFAELDKTSISAWLDENVPKDDYPELYSVLINSYRGEYGLECDEQSSLNLLYLIGSDEPDPFRVFGVSDERFHTHLGNQTFIDKLEKKLAKQIQLESKLVAVSGKRKGPYTLRFDTADGKLEVEAKRVVFALPFTLLREVDLSKLDLPDDKLNMIEKLGYGTNAKRIGSFKGRIWRDQHASGSVTTDAAFQQCWDTSLGQDGAQGILTNFLGGKTGLDSNKGDVEDAFVEVVKELDAAFAGLEKDYNAGSAVRMHWPSYKFTKASYACYIPGQWSFWGLEGEPVSNLHFCGEHTSADYQGYMEGGAESGSRAAGEILKDLGITPSAIHQALLDLKRDLPLRHSNGVPQFISRKRALRARLVAQLASPELA